MSDWVRVSIAYAKKQPALALAFCLASVTLILTAGVGVWLSVVAGNLEQETKDRIQLACDMSFANGQAILDTAAQDEEVPEETIELYRHNLQVQANRAIRKFDPDFECSIPEASNAKD